MLLRFSLQSRWTLFRDLSPSEFESDCLSSIILRVLYSRERQQQIEELLKELKRVSDEAETVKSALRNLKVKVSFFWNF